MRNLSKILGWRFIISVAAGLAISLILVYAAAGQPAPPGSVQPSGAQAQIDDLNLQADALNKELAALNLDLELVIERHNAMKVELETLTHELADSRARLEAMKQEQYSQEKLITDRLEAMYKAGDIDILSILLNSNSFNDFYGQARYVAKVNEQDARLQMEYKVRADEIYLLTDGIDEKRSTQLRLEDELGEQQEQIETRISQRQSKLDAVDARVRDILAQEAERQRLEQERIAAQLRAMVADLQITDTIQAQVVQDALRHLGVPYVWGGESPSGFDCSGLTKYVYARHGVNLPHNAALQFALGVPVPNDLLLPGDLVFWGPGSPHHVAMYIGSGKYVEAPTFGEVVKISVLDLSDGDYAGARRYPLRASTL